MKRTLVGTLDALWRYPVKSMQGEKLERSYIGKQGLLGDCEASRRHRAYALWDIEEGSVCVGDSIWLEEIEDSFSTDD